MRLEYVNHKRGYWELGVSMHGDMSTVCRPSGGSSDDWELVSGNLNVDLFNDCLEELFQEHLKELRNVGDALYK